MLLLPIFWIFIFLLIVEMIRLEDLCIFVRGILPCMQLSHEESRNDIGVAFHRENEPENDLSVEFLLQNVISESYKSHDYTTTCTSV